MIGYLGKLLAYGLQLTSEDAGKNQTLLVWLLVSVIMGHYKIGVLPERMDYPRNYFSGNCLDKEEEEYKQHLLSNCSALKRVCFEI